MNNGLLKAGIAVLVAGAIIAGWFLPKIDLSSLNIGSPAGTTFTNAKTAAIVADLAVAGSTGTSTSILNSDASTRYVTGTRAGCTNIGTSFTPVLNLTVAVGTTSAANPVLPAAAISFAKVGTITISTSTAQSFVFASSTTQTATSTLPAIWHSGEYMTFYANATNTAICTFGVDYIGA